MLRMQNFIEHLLDITDSKKSFENREEYFTKTFKPSTPMLIVTRYKDTVEVIEESPRIFDFGNVGAESAENIKMTFEIGDDGEWSPRSLKIGLRKEKILYVTDNSGHFAYSKPFLAEKAAIFERLWVNGLFERGHLGFSNGLSRDLNLGTKISVFRRVSDIFECMSRKFLLTG